MNFASKHGNLKYVNRIFNCRSVHWLLRDYRIKSFVTKMDARSFSWKRLNEAGFIIFFVDFRIQFFQTEGKCWYKPGGGFQSKPLTPNFPTFFGNCSEASNSSSSSLK